MLLIFSLSKVTFISIGLPSSITEAVYTPGTYVIVLFEAAAESDEESETEEAFAEVALAPVYLGFDCSEELPEDIKNKISAIITAAMAAAPAISHFMRITTIFV